MESRLELELERRIGLCAADASLLPPAVAQAMRHAERLPSLRPGDAILLFGSYARKLQREGSDVDLLVIGHAKPAHSFYDGDDVSVDILTETETSVHKKLGKTDEWNNNFMLNVLSDAVILKDPLGVATSLARQAETQRRAGPPAMSPGDASRAQDAIQLMLRSAKAGRERWARLTPEGRLLCKMRLDQVVSRCFYLMYKAKRRWTTSFPLLVAKAELEEPKLYGLWSEYVGAAPEDARSTVEKIVRLCLCELRQSSGAANHSLN